ncbi:MAG: hypothetical protein LBD09_00295, partial [Treponema sp.]|nr:hypothetical protein [Treponema sp.]
MVNKQEWDQQMARMKTNGFCFLPQIAQRFWELQPEPKPSGEAAQVPLFDGGAVKVPLLMTQIRYVVSAQSASSAVKSILLDTQKKEKTVDKIPVPSDTMFTNGIRAIGKHGV